jgi:L-alanine-DL-glutamate epimerase-like enolase superfamily enzyme
VIGIGEGTPYWSSIAEDFVKITKLTDVIQRLSLEEALDVLKLREFNEFERNVRIIYGAYSALEGAILSALSQYKRVKYEAELMGGIYRTEVPITHTIFLNNPKMMARKLEEAIKLNIKHIKFKIPCNLDELKKLLEIFYFKKKKCAIEDIVLRADANECFPTFEKAKKALLIIEKYDVNIVEQPLPRDKLKDIAKLRKEFYPVLEIMLDESLRKPSDIELFAQIEAADAINFHPSKLGCLTITREAILKAQRLGMKANIGSALMTEIGLFHYLNLAASIPRLDYPLEEPGLCNMYGYSIVQEPPTITNGYIKLFNIDVVDLDFNMIKKFLMRSLFKERLLGEVSEIYVRFKKIYSQRYSGGPH